MSLIKNVYKSTKLDCYSFKGILTYYKSERIAHKEWTEAILMRFVCLVDQNHVGTSDGFSYAILPLDIIKISKIKFNTYCRL